MSMPNCAYAFSVASKIYPHWYIDLSILVFLSNMWGHRLLVIHDPTAEEVMKS